MSFFPHLYKEIEYASTVKQSSPAIITGDLLVCMTTIAAAFMMH
jgi:hypothetical protein